MAEWMSGPRQMTGASPVRKYWMLIIFTPWLTTGFTRPALPVTWPSCVPIMSGTLGPVMSASKSPTVAPSRARLTARLTATVVLPTPPLPEATAIVFRTPGMRSAIGPPKVRFTFEAHSIFTAPAPRPVSSSAMSDSMVAFSGQAGVVSSTVTVTSEPSMSTDRTMFRATRSRPISGSFTRARAAMIASSVSVGVIVSSVSEDRRERRSRQADRSGETDQDRPSNRLALRRGGRPRGSTSRGGSAHRPATRPGDRGPSRRTGRRSRSGTRAARWRPA